MGAGLRSLLASLTGKVALAGVAAAVGLGGLAAAEVPLLSTSDTMDVPAAVDVDTAAEKSKSHGSDDEPDGDEPAGEKSGGGERAAALSGKAAGEERKEAVKTFTTAVKTWTQCASEAAATHQGGDGEGFSPHEACGDHPNPHDFGMTGPPEHASGRAKANFERHQERRQNGGDTENTGGADTRSLESDANANADDEGDESEDGNEGDEGDGGGDGRPAHAGPPDHAGPPAR